MSREIRISCSCGNVAVIRLDDSKENDKIRIKKNGWHIYILDGKTRYCCPDCKAKILSVCKSK